MTDEKADNSGEEEPLRRGQFVFPNGDRYDGEFRLTPEGAVERCGEGRHTTREGMTYEGEWSRDKMNGHGRLHFPSGACYEGGFADNKFEGRGRYEWATGEVYEGEFVGSRLVGQGELKDASDQEWVGMFRDQQAHGLRFKLMM